MTLRWGIVSAGKISHDFVNSVNSYPQSTHKIVGVAARDLNRAKNFAQVHNIENAYDSYEELAKSRDIDVAYIGAINPDHYSLTKLFLENGKHVLCEKPLCLNENQVKSLVNLARDKKLFLMEAVWSRFFPTYHAVEREINSGQLGDIVFTEVDFGVPIHAVDRVSKKDLGGSALLDIGIYVLQFSQFVFKDEPIKITSSGELNKDGVDVAASIILDYKGGRRAALNIHTKIRLVNQATVYGTKGSVTLLDPFHAPTKIEFSNGKVEEYPLHESKIPYNFENSAGLVFQANEVQRCINAGLLESPRMSHAHSLLLAKLEDTIRRQIGVEFEADKAN